MPPLRFHDSEPAYASAIQNTRGHVYTGGASLLHDLNPKWTLGGEVYGGYTNNDGLSKSQLQVMLGGKYTIREGLTFDFGVVGGRYVASPRIGVLVGVSVDLPAAVRSGKKKSSGSTVGAANASPVWSETGIK